MEQFSDGLRVFLANFGIDPGFVLFGNAVIDYANALFIFFGLLVVFRVFQFVILRRLQALAEKTKTDIDDTVIEVFRSLKPPFYSFLAFYLAVQFLALNEFLGEAVDAVLILWVFYQVVVGTQIFINHLIERRAAKDGDPTTRSALALVGRIAKGALWGLGILMVLSNLGVNVSSLLAGLGVGGIAVAFALQNILSDLFSSFAIYFDKPFKVGDFIIVGEHLGTVEKVGIKTTRLRALQGEEIVISNRELTSARIQNFKKMKERRITFAFGVVYQTPADKMKKIPQMVRETIEDMPSTRFDRAHFKEFQDSALGFEVVYYVLVPNYNEYMDIQEKINLGIMERFEKEKIEFAYPTRTLYIEK